LEPRIQTGGDSFLNMVTGLNHVTLSVVDLDRAFRFYRETLGLRPVARWYRGAYLTAGDFWICLTLESDLSERTLNSTYDHVAFTVLASDYQALCARLVDAGAQQWQENHSEGDSFYFLDPDGHKLEIHVTDLESRLAVLRQTPPKELVLFQPG
jgi:glutathione S-transferase fosA5